VSKLTHCYLFASPYVYMLMTCSALLLDADPCMQSMVSRLPVGPLEIPHICIKHYHTPTSVIEARLSCSSASSLVLTTLLPARVHADRPLDIDISVVGLCGDACAAAHSSNCFAVHASLAISVETPRQPRIQLSVSVSMRPSSGGWIARALAHPKSWANATSITVVSLSLARRPVLCERLPAELQVGYNHAPAPAGAVLKASYAGNVQALRTALDVGGSTEEADMVRW